MYRLYFIKYGKFLTTVSSNILFAIFSLSSPSGTPIVHTLVCLVLHRSLSLSSFFLIIFFSCSSDYIISTDISPISLFCLLPAQICYLGLLWHRCFCPPKIRILKYLPPKVMILGSGTFEKYLSQKGGALMNRISAC